MSSQKQHEDVTERMFGNRYAEFHEWKDKGLFTFGVPHRLFPPHDPVSAAKYAVEKKDPVVLLVSLAHDIEDCSPHGLIDSVRWAMKGFPKEE